MILCYLGKQEPLDLEERKKLLVYYLKGNPIQGELRVRKVTFEAKTGFFGGDQTAVIDGFKCKKYFSL